MATSCVICRRSDVGAIDELLGQRAAGVPGLSYAEIARQRGVVKSSLQRHDGHRTPSQAPDPSPDAPGEVPATTDVAETPAVAQAPSAPAQARWRRALARQQKLQEELTAARQQVEQLRAEAEQRRATRQQAERAVAAAVGRVSEAETALRAASADQLIASEPGAPADEREAAAEKVRRAEAHLAPLRQQLVAASAHRDALVDAERSAPAAQAAAQQLARAEAAVERLEQQLADLGPAIEQARRAAGDERVEQLRAEHRALIEQTIRRRLEYRQANQQLVLWYATVGAELAAWPALASAVEAKPFGPDASRPLGALPRDAVARARVLGAGEGEGWPVPLTLEMDLADSLDLVLDALGRNAGRGLRTVGTGDPAAPVRDVTKAHQVGIMMVAEMVGNLERVWEPTLGIGGERVSEPIIGRMRRLVELLRDTLGSRPEQLPWAPSAQRPEAEETPADRERRQKILRQVEQREREHAAAQREEEAAKAREWKRQQVR